MAWRAPPPPPPPGWYAPVWQPGPPPPILASHHPARPPPPPPGWYPHGPWRHPQFPPHPHLHPHPQAYPSPHPHPPHPSLALPYPAPAPPPAHPLWTRRVLRAQLAEALALIQDLKHILQEVEALTSAVESTQGDAHAEQAGVFACAAPLQSRLTVLLAPFGIKLGSGKSNTALPAKILEACKAVRAREGKLLRNRRRRKRTRQQLAQTHAQQAEVFEELDRAADDWRTRRIALDIAQERGEQLRWEAEEKAWEEQRDRDKEMETIVLAERLHTLTRLRAARFTREGRPTHGLADEGDAFFRAVEASARAEIEALASQAELPAVATRADLKMGTQPPPHQQQALLAASPDTQPQAEPLKEKKEPLSRAENQPYVVDDEPTWRPELTREMEQFYYGAGVSINTLVEIRRAWDSFLVPGGSRIPSTWVEPPEPSSAGWLHYLVRPQLERKRRQRRRTHS